MIFLELFLAFLRVGCFSFGGGYAAIPLIRDVVLEYGWIGEDALSYMIAVSESTPGPIMVNLATYAGSTTGSGAYGVVGGIVGAIIATFAVILPAFVIVLLIMAAFNRFMKNDYARAILDGLKPCIIGIILSVGAHMLVTNCFIGLPFKIEWRAVIITAVLSATMLISKFAFKKKLSPIMLIVISAFLGIFVYS